MNYILIVGTKDAGKSTTINAVCHKLEPTVIQRLNPDTKTLENLGTIIQLFNGTYIIEVNGKVILVSAGAPTEQGISITILIDICVKIGVKLDFAIIAIRTRENKLGFDTKTELKNHGECILQEKISRINGEDFKNKTEWEERIKRIYEKITFDLKD